MCFIDPSFRESGNFETAEAVAQAIRLALPDYEVVVHSPQGAADEFLQLARTLFIDVPWDNIAALGTMLVVLRRWLTTRVRALKERAAREGDPPESRPQYFFPEGASHEEKETLLRTTSYRITLYSHRTDAPRPLAVIEIDETMEEAMLNRNPPRRQMRNS